MSFFLCYRPTSFDKDILCKSLDDTLQRVHKEYENVCVLGDFTFPEIQWSSYNDCQHEFCSLMGYFVHFQI